MDNTPITKNPEAIEAAEEKKAEELKAKYGKVYKVGVTIPVDDIDSLDMTYYFKKPSLPAYDRFVKTMNKVGASAASKRFLMDAVVDEDKERLVAVMDEYPGVAITVGNKLSEILGLTDSVNLRKL